MKDNEQHRTVAVFRQKSVCRDIRHHRVTLQSQTELLFIHNSFVVSGAHSAVDHILFYVLKLTCCAELCIFTLFIGSTQHTCYRHIFITKWPVATVKCRQWWKTKTVYLTHRESSTLVATLWRQHSQTACFCNHIHIILRESYVESQISLLMLLGYYCK